MRWDGRGVSTALERQPRLQRVHERGKQEHWRFRILTSGFCHCSRIKQSCDPAFFGQVWIRRGTYTSPLAISLFSIWTVCYKITRSRNFNRKAEDPGHQHQKHAGNWQDIRTVPLAETKEQWFCLGTPSSREAEETRCGHSHQGGCVAAGVGSLGRKCSSMCQHTSRLQPPGHRSPAGTRLELLQHNNSSLHAFLKASRGRNRGKDNMRNLPSLPRATCKEQDDLYFRRMCLCSKNVIFF